ncbi:MAG: PHP domain-containing protein [FCB group bacterium]|nr:PHP domain-containing protein [FCB group bacterium]
MSDYIDLHIHSDHSDGRQTPIQIVDDSLSMGLKAISITDHDALDGCADAIEYARGKDIQVLSGIELSASKTIEDIHILGYLFRIDDSRLQETIEMFRRIRHERGKKMIARMAGLGMNVDFERLVELAGQAAIGRPHLAEIMLKEGFVGSYNEAFAKYLYLGGPVYVPKAKLTPAEAINIIHEAGGVAVMAHPLLSERDDMIEELAASGLDGLEIYHPAHKAQARGKYRKIAERLGLFISGGSDSHNRKGRYGDIGDQNVPFEYLQDITARWQELNNRRK